MKSMKTPVRLMLPLLILAVPETAHAHLVSTRFGEFYSGLLHPLTTLVHLVPWLALAMFASLQGKDFVRRTLPLFPLAVGIGVVLGFSFGGIQHALLLNIISFVVLGGLVALSCPVHRLAGLGTVLLFAISHGYANGDVDLADGSLALYVAGVTAAAYLIVTLGAGAAAALNDKFGTGLIVLRVFGSWILAAGLIYGGFELMGVSGA